ncbi:MAG TPA: MgtC/SapB family protein [Gemmatimonadaceae bacterium]|nr:MgtC/SapB family protein [Gemmatimonadaceae bacterium]
MIPVDTSLDAAARLSIAGLVGIGVGLERERSGRASGPHARFAGLRTFLLMGLLGGSAGLVAGESAPAAAALVAGGMGFAIAAYVMAVRAPDADLDGTTEAAALVVVAIGMLAGLGRLALAAGTGSLIVLVLSEKTRLHELAQHIGETELRAALQFAALALVVLPLLPEGPYFGMLAVRPRALWMAVLLFSGLNFLGYLARRGVGMRRGYGIAGMLGGLVSSTLVTLEYSRQSRAHPERRTALATGVVGACTVLLPRVAVLSAALNPGVAAALVPRILLPVAVGVVLTAWNWRGHEPAAGNQDGGPENPLHLVAAIRMALLFQVAIVLLRVVRDAWGPSGLYATSAVLGLSDVDALTVAMSSAGPGVAEADAARAIMVGVAANTVVKLGLATALGAGTYRRRAAAGLSILGVAIAAGLAIG